MNKYKAQWSYSATINHSGISFAEGEEVWLDEDTAAIINRDSPGILLFVKAGTSHQPHAHRMVTGRNIGLRDVSTITDEIEPKEELPAVTPAARKMAEDKGLELKDIPFSGDKITVQDVRSAIGDKAEVTVQPTTKFAATKSGKSL